MVWPTWNSAYRKPSNAICSCLIRVLSQKPPAPDRWLGNAKSSLQSPPGIISMFIGCMFHLPTLPRHQHPCIECTPLVAYNCCARRRRLKTRSCFIGHGRCATPMPKWTLSSAGTRRWKRVEQWRPSVDHNQKGGCPRRDTKTFLTRRPTKRVTAI